MISKRVYRSSIGWMFPFVSLLTAICLIGSFICIQDDESRLGIIIAYVIAAIGYFWALVYPLINTKYVLESDRLIIICGMYKRVIYFRQIVDVYKKKSLGRQPALSENRVFIKYKEYGEINDVGISPKSLEDFTREIKEKMSLSGFEQE